MFKANDRSPGFQIQFANGWRVSVQWGPGTYSDREWGSPEDRFGPDSSTAEVAVFSPSGRFVQIGLNEDVVPYCSPDAVLKIMTLAAYQDGEVWR